MKEPSKEKIMSMFNLLTDFVKKTVNPKDSDDVLAMAGALFLVYEAIREGMDKNNDN